MEPMYRISVAASMLGVCARTIRRWDAAGKIRCGRTVGGHRRVARAEVARILGQRGLEANRGHGERVAIYCRVSSHDQRKKGDLDRQAEVLRVHCIKTGEHPVHVLSDVGSGLNARRAGLRKLFKLVERGQLDKVMLTYPDRLTRFGLEYLRAYFASHGVDIVTLNEQPGTSAEEELVQDLVAIVTSFSGRVHGMRSHRNSRGRGSGAEGPRSLATGRSAS